MEQEIEVLIAGPEHEKYVDTILETIADAAKVRGTGIAKRTICFHGVPSVILFRFIKWIPQFLFGISCLKSRFQFSPDTLR